MKHSTEIAIWNGDMFPDNPACADECHTCGKKIEMRGKRMLFSSIQTADNHSGRLSWCVVCNECALKIMAVLKEEK
jgi:hypothetical protein